MDDDNSFPLDFQGTSFSFGESCVQCTRKDKEIHRLCSEQAKNEANFKFLKTKIIATDQVLRKFKAKTDECNKLTKEIEEWLRKFEKSQMDVAVLDAQLRRALEEMEPVKKAKGDLEKQLEMQEKEKKKLQDQLNEAEFLNNQYEMRVANLEAAKSTRDEATADSKRKNSTLENKLKQQGNKISKLQGENKKLKIAATKQERTEKRLEARLKRTENKLMKHLDILVQNGLMTKKARVKVMATANRLDRNEDSDIGSVSGNEESLSEVETDVEEVEGDDAWRETSATQLSSVIGVAQDTHPNTMATTTTTTTTTPAATAAATPTATAAATPTATAAATTLRSIHCSPPAQSAPAAKSPPRSKMSRRMSFVKRKVTLMSAVQEMVDVAGIAGYSAAPITPLSPSSEEEDVHQHSPQVLAADCPVSPLALSDDSDDVSDADVDIPDVDMSGPSSRHHSPSPVCLPEASSPNLSTRTVSVPNSVDSVTMLVPNSVSSVTMSVPNSVGSATMSVPNSVGSVTMPAPNSVGSVTVPVPNSVGSGTMSVPNSVGSVTVPVPNSVSSGTMSAPNSVSSGTMSAPNSVGSGTTSVPNSVGSVTVSQFLTSKATHCSAASQSAEELYCEGGSSDSGVFIALPQTEEAGVCADSPADGEHLKTGMNTCDEGGTGDTTPLPPPSVICNSVSNPSTEEKDRRGLHSSGGDSRTDVVSDCGPDRGQPQTGAEDTGRSLLTDCGLADRGVEESKAGSSENVIIVQQNSGSQSAGLHPHEKPGAAAGPLQLAQAGAAEGQRESNSKPADIKSSVKTSASSQASCVKDRKSPQKEKSPLPSPRRMVTRRMSQCESADSEAESRHRAPPPASSPPGQEKREEAGRGEEDGASRFLDLFLYPGSVLKSPEAPDRGCAILSEKENRSVGKTKPPSRSNTLAQGPRQSSPLSAGKENLVQLFVEESVSPVKAHSALPAKSVSSASELNAFRSDRDTVALDTVRGDLDLSDDDDDDDSDDADEAGEGTALPQTQASSSHQASQHSLGVVQRRQTALTNATAATLPILNQEIQDGKNIPKSACTLSGDGTVPSGQTPTVSKKTYTVPEAVEISLSSSSECEDTSDLSFSDSSPPPPPTSSRRPRRRPSQGLCEDQRSERRKPAEKQQLGDKPGSTAKAAKPVRGKAARQKARLGGESLEASPERGVLTKSSAQQNNSPAAFSAKRSRLQCLEDDSSSDSLPIYPSPKKKVPRIVESERDDSSEEELENPAKLKPQKMRKVGPRRPAMKSSARVESDSSDSEGEPTPVTAGPPTAASDRSPGQEHCPAVTVSDLSEEDAHRKTVTSASAVKSNAGSPASPHLETDTPAVWSRGQAELPPEQDGAAMTSNTAPLTQCGGRELCEESSLFSAQHFVAEDLEVSDTSSSSSNPSSDSEDSPLGKFKPVGLRYNFLDLDHQYAAKPAGDVEKQVQENLAQHAHSLEVQENRAQHAHSLEVQENLAQHAHSLEVQENLAQHAQSLEKHSQENHAQQAQSSQNHGQESSTLPYNTVHDNPSSSSRKSDEPALPTPAGSVLQPSTDPPSLQPSDDAEPGQKAGQGEKPPQGEGSRHLQPCAELNLSDIEADCKQQRGSAVGPPVIRPEAVSSLTSPLLELGTAEHGTKRAVVDGGGQDVVTPVRASREVSETGASDGGCPPLMSPPSGSLMSPPSGSLMSPPPSGSLMSPPPSGSLMSSPRSAHTPTLQIGDSEHSGSSPFKRVSTDRRRSSVSSSCGEDGEGCQVTRAPHPCPVSVALSPSPGVSVSSTASSGCVSTKPATSCLPVVVRESALSPTKPAVFSPVKSVQSTSSSPPLPVSVTKSQTSPATVVQSENSSPVVVSVSAGQVTRSPPTVAQSINLAPLPKVPVAKPVDSPPVVSSVQSSTAGVSEAETRISPLVRTFTDSSPVSCDARPADTSSMSSTPCAGSPSARAGQVTDTGSHNKGDMAASVSVTESSKSPACNGVPVSPSRLSSSPISPDCPISSASLPSLCQSQSTVATCPGHVSGNKQTAEPCLVASTTQPPLSPKAEDLSKHEKNIDANVLKTHLDNSHFTTGALNPKPITESASAVPLCQATLVKEGCIRRETSTAARLEKMLAVVNMFVTSRDCDMTPVPSPEPCKACESYCTPPSQDPPFIRCTGKKKKQKHRKLKQMADLSGETASPQNSSTSGYQGSVPVSTSNPNQAASLSSVLVASQSRTSTLGYVGFVRASTSNQNTETSLANQNSASASSQNGVASSANQNPVPSAASNQNGLSAVSSQVSKLGQTLSRQSPIQTLSRRQSPNLTGSRQSPNLTGSRQSPISGAGITPFRASQKAGGQRAELLSAVEKAKREMMLRKQALAQDLGVTGVTSNAPSPAESRSSQSSLSMTDSLGKGTVVEERRKEEGISAAVPDTGPRADPPKGQPGQRQQRKRKMAEDGSAPVTPAKRKVTAKSRAGIPKVLLGQRVQDVVGDYYTESSVSVETVLEQLRQIGRLSDCWVSVILTVVMLLKSAERSLQGEVVRQCARGNLSSASQTQLRDRVFMGTEELRFLHLLLRCMEQDGGCDRTRLMQTLWTSILSTSRKDRTSVTQRASLCRLFVGVCGSSGLVEEVRSLAYQVVLRKVEGVVTVVLAIAAAWPRALARHSPTDTTGVVVVMEHIVMTTIASNPALAKLAVCFERLCQWEHTTPDAVWLMNVHVKALQAAFESGLTACSPHVYSLCRCLQMLCAANDAMWLVKNFLERAVRSALLKWSAKGEAGSSHHLVVVLCRLVGTVTGPELKAKNKVLTQLMNAQVRSVLFSPHKHPEVEKACLELLLSLSPLKPPMAFSIIADYCKARPSALSPAFQERILALKRVVNSRTQNRA